MTADPEVVTQPVPAKEVSDDAVEAGSEAIVDLLKRTRNEPHPPTFGEMARAAITAALPFLTTSKGTGNE